MTCPECGTQARGETVVFPFRCRCGAVIGSDGSLVRGMVRQPATSQGQARLGDWIAGSLAALGIVHKHTWIRGVNRLRRWLGLPDYAACNCDERREWLNRQHSQVVAWMERASNSLAISVAKVLRHG